MTLKHKLIYLPLEYEYAFNICGNAVNSAPPDKKILIAIDDEVLLHNMLNRSFREVYSTNRSLSVLDEDIQSSKFDILIWMPRYEDKKNYTEAIKKINKLLSPEGKFIIIFPQFRFYNLVNGFVKFELKKLFSDFMFPFKVTKNLKRAGFSIQKVYGIHSPKNVMFSFLMKISKNLGRGDLEDVLFFRSKEHYVTTSWLKNFSTTVLIKGVK